MLKKTIRYLFILFIGLFALSSCGTPIFITTSEMCIYKPGVKYEGTEFCKVEPAFILNLDSLGPNKFEIFVYKKLEVSGGSFLKFDFCAFAFKNDLLYYWGYVDDFKKEDDSIIQKIGELISLKLIEKY